MSQTGVRRLVQDRPVDSSPDVGDAVTYSELRRDFEFLGLHSMPIDANLLYPRGVFLIVRIENVSTFVEEFRFLIRAHLRLLCNCHGLVSSGRERHARLVDLLRLHDSCTCPVKVYLFRMLRAPRQNVVLRPLPAPCESASDALPTVRRERTGVRRARDSSLRIESISENDKRDETDPDFPSLRTWEEKVNIIREWQDEIERCTEPMKVCAVCGWCIASTEIMDVEPGRIDFSLLTNDCIPEHVMPTTYDRAKYGNAILCTKGLRSPFTFDVLRVCYRCRSSLFADKPKQPKFALANFLYYGRERLPSVVADAFKNASTFDLMLISRAKGSVITHHYVRQSARGGYIPEDCSQRFNRGNVAIFPQDAVQLRNVLPPTRDDIKDTLCVVFSSSRGLPSAESLKRFKPVLVCKSRVETMINFLVNNNEWYVSENVKFNRSNLDDLFGDENEHLDDGLLKGMQIHHLREDGSCDVGEWSGNGDDFLMDNIAYTEGDHSPRSREHMKLHALAHALDHKQFVHSSSGCNFLSNDFPGLLSFMFPHLDPWGIGGFFHPGRRREQYLSFNAQVESLLHQHDSPFIQDPLFPFICWNMIQKRSVSIFNTFGVRTTQHHELARQLESLAPHMSAIVNKWEKDEHRRAETLEERSALKLLKQINTLSKNLQGSAGYKLCRRNEVRSLIRTYSTPAFFITLNPHDFSSHVFARLMQIDDAEWEQKSSYERATITTKFPDVAAKAFDIQIRTFVDIVLRCGSGTGLFGRCDAYYGMVEAQGRGTLHCHMLVWISGNPSPQELRDQMVMDESFKEHMFSWLEDSIHSELPGATAHTVPPYNIVRPVWQEDELDPRIERQPRVREMSEDTFQSEFTRMVGRLAIECNWHIHNDTCFKYLKQGESRTDSSCRMRISGETRMRTELDDDTQSILLRRLHPWINNYNDIILFLLQSNMDIKYIGSGPAAKALVYYISDYITKTELKVHSGIRSIQTALQAHTEKFSNDKNSSKMFKERNLLTKCVNSLMARQEISHQQVMSYLVGGGDYYTSHRFTNVRFFEFLNALESMERDETSDSDDEVTSTYGDNGCESQALILNTNIDDFSVASDFLDYMYRPQSFEVDNMCLWEFFESTVKLQLSEAEKAHHTPTDMNDNDSNIESIRRRSRVLLFSCENHPQFNTHAIKKRTEMVVPVLLGINVPNQKDNEEAYYKYMMLIFKPWWKLHELKEEGDSWKQSFERFRFPLRIRELIKNMSVEMECRDAKVTYSDQLRVGALNGVSDQENIPADMLTNDSEDLIGLLSEDLSINDQILVYDRMNDSEDNEYNNTSLTEDEICVREIANRILRDAAIERSLIDTGTAGHLIELTEESSCVLTDYTKKMRLEKSLKRPVTDDLDNDQPVKRQRSGEQPSLSVEVLLDNVHVSDVECQRLKDKMQVVNTVHSEFHFDSNKEQSRAFRLVSQHFVQCKSEQMLMFITGMGGSGKSHIIKAIIELFRRCGHSDDLLTSAPTGCAAILINGYTIHALTFLPGKMTMKNRQELEGIWTSVRYLVLDEISMISAELLSEISERITIAKGFETSSKDKPFGGVNVIFAGDLCQLRPVIGYALYAHNFTNQQSTRIRETKGGQNGLFGASIWRELTHVVNLRKNMRAKEDPTFVNFLERQRIGHVGLSNYNGPSDYEVLKTRLMEHIAKEQPDEYKMLCKAPVVFGTRRLRDQFNEIRARQFTSDSHQNYNTFLAIDKVNGKRMTGRERIRLCGLRTTEAKELLGFLPLIPGMPVMITENLSMRHKIVNGTKGTLIDIIYRESDEGKEAVCAYVEVPRSNLDIHSSNKDVVPVFPQSTSFVYKLQSSRQKICILRSQLPLVPAWAFTDYKVQGSTLQTVVVDLASACNLQHGYVMLSRAKSFSHLGILRWFPPHRIFSRIQEDLRHELERLDILDNQTARSFVPLESE